MVDVSFVVSSLLSLHSQRLICKIINPDPAFVITFVLSSLLSFLVHDPLTASYRQSPRLHQKEWENKSSSFFLLLQGETSAGIADKLRIFFFSCLKFSSAHSIHTSDAACPLFCYNKRSPCSSLYSCEEGFACIFS